MKKKLFTFVVLMGILALASAIYFYKIDQIPSGFYIDEATTAYNAYSILTTGKDEFGKSFPILFRLFGSYTPPLFIYLSAILIRFFGMGIATFRSVSAICALMSIVVFFLMINKLQLYKQKMAYFLITLFYAISPWLVFNARLGYEVTLGYLIFNIGLYFSYLALENSKYLLYALPIFSLAVYSSHNQKYLTPLFILFYLFVFRKQIFRRQNYRNLAVSFLIALLLQIPNFFVVFTPAFWIKNIGYTNGTPWQKTITNIVMQLLNYFSPKSLFYFLPDIDPQHTMSEISIMFNWMVVPYVLGIYFLFKEIKRINFKFIALVFLASVLPAALSGEFISVQRALPFLFPLSVVIGLGIDFVLIKTKKIYAGLLFSMVSIYSLLMLYRSYFVLFPKDRAIAWSYGYSDLAKFIASNPKESFFIDNSRNLGLYMELLYFLRYPPAKYQSEVTSLIRERYYQAPSLGGNFNFANIRVGGIDWKEEVYKEQIIIGDDLAISEGQAREHFMTKIYELKDPLGKIVFKGYKTNPAEKCKNGFLLKLKPDLHCVSKKP